MLQVTNQTQYLRFEMTQLLQFKKEENSFIRVYCT